MPPSDSMNEPVSEQAAPDLPPINVAIAKEMLKEAKQIMDALGVVFFLRLSAAGHLPRPHQGQ